MASVVQLKNLKWFVQIRRGKVNLRKVFIQKTAADKWAREQETKIEKGEITESTHNMPTMREALERYRDHTLDKKRESTQKSQGYLIKRLLTEPFVDERIDKITPDVFAAMRDRRLVVVGAQNVRHELSLLRHMYNTAIGEWNKNIVNPIRKGTVKFPSPPQARTQSLDPIQAQRFWRALDTYFHGGIDFTNFVRFQMESSYRRSESLSIQWADVDWDNCLITLPITKTGQADTRTITEKGLAILRQQRMNPNGPFEHLTFAAVMYHWKKLLTLADVSDFHVHDMRGVAITRMLNAGISDLDVMDATGHTSTKMLGRYYRRNKKDSAKRLNAALATL